MSLKDEKKSAIASHRISFHRGPSKSLLCSSGAESLLALCFLHQSQWTLLKLTLVPYKWVAGLRSGHSLLIHKFSEFFF